MTQKIIKIKQSTKKIDDLEKDILIKKMFFRIIDLLHIPSDIISIDETGFNNFMF